MISHPDFVRMQKELQSSRSEVERLLSSEKELRKQLDDSRAQTAAFAPTIGSASNATNDFDDFL